jgi:WD40 repeat protein
MNAVGNTRVEDNWAMQQTYPMWKELPLDVTYNQVLTLLDPLDLSRCSVVCKQWHRFLTNKDVWEPLSRFHFPSLPLGFLKSFQAYQCLYSNLSRGVCSVKVLQEHTEMVNSLVLRDGMLFSASDDCTITIWSLETNTCIDTLKGHVDGVTSLALGDGVLFSASADDTIKIWNLEDNTCIHTLEGHTDVVTSLALRNTTLFSSSFDKTIKAWDLRDNTCTATLEGHVETINCIALRDTMLFSATNDTIKIWDLKSNVCTATLSDAELVNCLALNNTTLFAGAFDGTLEIWDLKTNTRTSYFREHSYAINALVLGDTTLFSSSRDGTIKIWDLKSHTCTATLEADPDVASCALKDATLFSGSSNGTIRIWDFAANHAQIFMEIANALEGQNQQEATLAIDRFSKMPTAAKNKIFIALDEIVCLGLEAFHYDTFLQYAAKAFYRRDEEDVTNAERAEAIKNYLSK